MDSRTKLYLKGFHSLLFNNRQIKVMIYSSSRIEMGGLQLIWTNHNVKCLIYKSAQIFLRFVAFRTNMLNHAEVVHIEEDPTRYACHVCSLRKIVNVVNGCIKYMIATIHF